jgi:hypothetical protein
MRFFLPDIAPLLVPAVLAAQVGAETRPRTVFLVGASGMVGAYSVVEPDTGLGRHEAKHNYRVGGISLAARRKITSGIRGSVRLSAFTGIDVGGRVKRSASITDLRPIPKYDTARKDVIDGVAASATVDFRYVGLTAGITSGRWLYTYEYPIRDGSTSRQQKAENFAARLGPWRGTQVELGFGTHEPTFAPGPVIKGGLAFETENAKTWRVLRLGLSDEGLYVGGLRVLQDVEIEPYFTVGSSSMRQISISARYRM